MKLLLQIFCGLFAILPRRVAYAIGRGAGTVVGSVIRHRRGEVLASMRRAFPDKTEAEIRRMAADMYRHLGLTVVEIARFAAIGRRELEGRVRVVQDERHAKLAAQPRGALILSGHFGNWEFSSDLASTLPRPTHAIVKPLRPAAFQDFVVRMRANMNLHLLSFRGGFGEALRALRRGEVVTVILDQNQRRTMGVFVDFLGEQACTSHGLAILSTMSGAPVFPVYGVRGPDGRHEIRVLDPIPPPPDREPETILRFTQTYTRALEDIVRLHPEQWTWIHRRWRTRPKDGGRGTDDGGRTTERG